MQRFLSRLLGTLVASYRTQDITDLYIIRSAVGVNPTAVFPGLATGIEI